MGSRENSRVDPRREMTCSIVSFGRFASSSGTSGITVPLAGGIFRLYLLLRHDATSSLVVSEELACILRIAGYSTSLVEYATVGRSNAGISGLGGISSTVWP